MDLNFTIENQILKRVDSQKIVNKSRNYINCNFSFETSEWDSIEKFAIFSNSQGSNFVVNLGTPRNCKAVVPSDVLVGDFFLVSVYGGDLITTNTKKVALIRSGYTTNISSTVELKTDVFVQLFEKLDFKFESVSFIDNVLTFYTRNDDGELEVLETIDLNLTPLAYSASVNDIPDFDSGFDARMELWMQDLIDGINEL